MPPKDESKNQDQRLSAVIVAESFEPRFKAITPSKSLGELEVCGVRAIDYTLRWVARCDISNVVIVVSEAHATSYQNSVSSWKGAFDSVKLVICQNAHSIGDALREVFSRDVVKGAFLLVPSPLSLCSSTLQSQMKAFRARIKRDSNAVISLIYSESRGASSAVAVDEFARLTAYHSQSDHTKLDTDKEEFRSGIKIRKDVVDTGLAIFSLQALSSFTDNFDFQTRDEVIRHILVNEEVMLHYITVEVLPSYETAISVFDYASFIRMNEQLISRCYYPIIPISKDAMILYNAGNMITCGRQRVRVEGWNSYIGEGVTSSSRASIVASSIGRNASIGSGCRVVESIVGDGCRLADDTVLQEVFLAENVTIEQGQIVPKKVVVGPNVRLDGSISVEEGSFIASSSPDEELEDEVQCTKLAEGVYAWRGKGGEWWRGEWKAKKEETEEVERRGEGLADEEDEDEVEKSDEEIFTDEVFDTFNATLSLEKISAETVNKMIVEINSSKIAYNIAMGIVAKNIFIAFLRLPGNETMKTLKARIDSYIRLFRNYYSSEAAQSGLLKGLHEHFTNNVSSFGPMVAPTIHYLFNEKDILKENETIIEWNDNLDKQDPVIPLIQKLIDWLRENSDDDDEEEDE